VAVVVAVVVATAAAAASKTSSSKSSESTGSSKSSGCVFNLGVAGEGEVTTGVVTLVVLLVAVAVEGGGGGVAIAPASLALSACDATVSSNFSNSLATSMARRGVSFVGEVDPCGGSGASCDEVWGVFVVFVVTTAADATGEDNLGKERLLLGSLRPYPLFGVVTTVVVVSTVLPADTGVATCCCDSRGGVLVGVVSPLKDCVAGGVRDWEAALAPAAGGVMVAREDDSEFCLCMASASADLRW
jgi:hypothetical protein